MPKKFTPGQRVRIISVDDESVLRRYPDIKEHLGETGDIAQDYPSLAGSGYEDIKPTIEGGFYEVKLHQSKQPIIVPAEAVEPC